MDMLSAESLLNLDKDLFNYNGVVFNKISTVPEVYVDDIVSRIAVLFEYCGTVFNGFPIGPCL
ncbi:MAG: hypothetical protein ACO22R_08965 [Chitinophagaceae bacterium]